jgi:hypothetical protein
MAPTFDCVTIEKAVDPDFAALNPGYLLKAATWRGTVGRLLRLDVGGLDDRPPFVDFRRVKGA